MVSRSRRGLDFFLNLIHPRKEKKKKKKALRSSLGKRSVSLRVGLERRCEYGIMDIMVGPVHDGDQMSVGRHGELVVST